MTHWNPKQLTQMKVRTTRVQTGEVGRIEDPERIVGSKLPMPTRMMNVEVASNADRGSIAGRVGQPRTESPLLIQDPYRI